MKEWDEFVVKLFQYTIKHCGNKQKAQIITFEFIVTNRLLDINYWNWWGYENKNLRSPLLATLVEESRSSKGELGTVDYTHDQTTMSAKLEEG